MRVPIAAELKPARDRTAAMALPARLAFASGAEVELAAGARAKVLPALDVAFGPGQRGRCALVAVDAGEIQVEVPASPASACVVVAAGSALVAARAGSTARVRPVGEGADRALATGAYRGDVRASSGGSWARVHVGSTVIVGKQGGPRETAQMSAGPGWFTEDAFSSRRPLAIVTDAGARAALSARFVAASPSRAHLLEVARDASFDDVVATGDAPAGDSTLRTPELPVGRYFARVRVRGDHGLPGLPGPARELRVERLILPAGAAAEANGFVMPLGRTARFADGSGIELALGPRGYHPAPSGFGLASDAPVTARARLAGDRWSVPLRLEPTTLRADVELGPKTAVWPRDAIEITVALADSRRPVPAIEPKLTVRVGLEEVPVEWRRDGAVWRARLDPRPTPGPWVVRVEATDPQGSTLGRGHLEVIAQ
jgi:hypothetical protein